MALTQKQTALLKVAVKQLGIDDDTYRTILLRLAGVHTSTELTADGFTAVMGYLEYIGFKPLSSVGPYYGERPGMPSPGKVQLMRDLWVKYARRSDWAEMDRWLQRTYKVAALRFCDDATANKAIVALKRMAARPAKGARTG